MSTANPPTRRTVRIGSPHASVVMCTLTNTMA